MALSVDLDGLYYSLFCIDGIDLDPNCSDMDPNGSDLEPNSFDLDPNGSELDPNNLIWTIIVHNIYDSPSRS